MRPGSPDSARGPPLHSGLAPPPLPRAVLAPRRRAAAGDPDGMSRALAPPLALALHRARALPLAVVLSLCSPGGVAVDAPRPDPGRHAALASSAQGRIPQGATARPRWVAPLAPPVRVLRRYEQPPTDYSAGHRGIDIAAAPGMTILAPESGLVTFSGPVAGRPVVSVLGDSGVLASIEPVDGLLGAGARVQAGSPLGTVSSGGHCQSDCVHLGARVAGRYIDPAVLLGLGRRAVLLPLGRGHPGRRCLRRGCLPVPRFAVRASGGDSGDADPAGPPWGARSARTPLTPAGARAGTPP